MYVEGVGVEIESLLRPPGLLLGIGPGNSDMSQQPHWGRVEGTVLLGSCSG